mmetsp:Transcript_11622/g.30709  ORF Transcript_11622/g.30709 Transcript_11622/m.30709 type:complete len:347 (+) Transcript_11622:37-1077(+)
MLNPHSIADWGTRIAACFIGFSRNGCGRTAGQGLSHSQYKKLNPSVVSNLKKRILARNSSTQHLKPSPHPPHHLFVSLSCLRREVIREHRALAPLDVRFGVGELARALHLPVARNMVRVQQHVLVVHLDDLLTGVVLPVLLRGLVNEPGALDRRGVVPERLLLAHVLGPERLAEARHVAVGDLVLGGEVLGLVHAHGHLGVADAGHGALVDVGGADDGVFVVDDEHLGVDVDHVAAARVEDLAVHGGRGTRGEGAFLGLAGAEARQDDPVGGRVGGADFGERFLDPHVDHLDGSELPVEDFLHRGVRGDALGMHGDGEVRDESLAGLDLGADLERDLDGDQMRGHV